MPLPNVPATTTAPHESEAARRAALLARVRQTRAKLIFNRGEINGNKPNKEYSWVNRAEERIVFYKAMGYEICRDPDIKSAWRQEDGTHIRGDVILMEVDKEWHEALRLDEQDRAVSALEGKTDEFERDMARVGVPTFKPRA